MIQYPMVLRVISRYWKPFHEWRTCEDLVRIMPCTEIIKKYENAVRWVIEICGYQ